MSAWSLAKNIRTFILGEFCELCGSEILIVGHHVKNRGPNRDCKREIIHDWRNCQLRCLVCEEKMHTRFEGRGGNNKKSFAIQRENNRIIELALSCLIVEFFFKLNRGGRRII